MEEKGGMKPVRGPESGATSPSELRPKARQIVDAARRLFLTESYDQVTMDMVAQEASVSKATLYSYFPSKEELFANLIIQKCRTFENQFDLQKRPDEDIEAALYRIGYGIVSSIDTEESQCFYRLMVSELHRFPSLVMTFERAGPASLRDKLRSFFEEIVAGGLLRISDLDLATEQFFALTIGRVSFDRSLGLPSLSPEATKRQIDGAVSMFMASYGANRPSDRP